MFCCYGGATGTLWGWWWMIPLMGFILCFSMCFFFRRKATGRRWCFGGGIRFPDFESVKKEIRELREEIDKIKEK